MKGVAELEIAKAAFADLQAQFPSLRMVPDPNAPVESSLQLPVQPGLSQPVWLGLQNGGELHFSVGHFSLEWFPCTNPVKLGHYTQSVAGYLSGRYRIVEHYIGSRCVKAELQSPIGTQWKTEGTWSTLGALVPGKRTSRALRNDAQPDIQTESSASGGSWV